VVSFTPRQLYPRGNKSRYPSGRRSGGLQEQVWSVLRRKNILPLPKNKLWILSWPPNSLVELPTGLSGHQGQMRVKRKTGRITQQEILTTTLYNFSLSALLPIRQFTGCPNYCVYRVIHKSLRNFQTRLRNNQDRHGRKEHINRYRISQSFFCTSGLGVLPGSTARG